VKNSKLLLAIVFLCLVIPSAFAQVNAVLGGTVADPSGAVVPGAQVRATNVNTGIVSTLTTNAVGNFQFSSLQPGQYTLSAMFTGFQTTTLTNVLLSQGQQVRQNIQLQLASAAQTVEVTAVADTLLTETSNSAGTTLNERAILSLPVTTRNVLDMVATAPGVIYIQGAFASIPNFSGLPAQMVNTTRDGITTNDGRYNNSNGAYSSVFTSPDMVEEVRISTNAIDPSMGRGPGQVQMRTRGGGNDFHGALFYTNSNSALSSLTWFNNLVGAKKGYANRNQFGGRVGGPIIKNKAFFFVLIDDQRYLDKNLTTATVLTPEARQGIFRYLTTGGVGGTTRQNGNAIGGTPSVDLNGNIKTVDEKGAPLFLNSFNLFTGVQDPLRTGIDPIFFAKYLQKMPLPNDYTVGDGLNTAGYRFFTRRDGVDGSTGVSSNTNRNHLTSRFDYQINDNHKVTFTLTREKDWGLNAQTGIRGLPEGFDGTLIRKPIFYTVQYTAVLTPTILNEFRYGVKKDPWQGTSPFDAGCCFDGAGERDRNAAAAEALAFYPKTSDGTLIYVAPSYANLAPFGVAAPRYNQSPLHQIADTVSLNKGAHSIQAGFELSQFYSQGNNTGGQSTTRPSTALGSGDTGFPINITSTRFPGLNANDITPAKTLLGNLAGTVGNITEQFFINSPTDQKWLDYRDTYFFRREHHQNDWSLFVKDNWKVTRSLTFNMGLRYDKYGTPYDQAGIAGGYVGGQSALFGISGTNFANALWAPGVANGSLTNTQFIGKNSPHPDQLVFGNDWNNFGPSFGFAWNAPGRKHATVIRGGYGLSYAGAPDFLEYSGNFGNIPGLNANPTFTPSSASGYLDLKGLSAASGNFLPINPGVAAPGLPQPVLSATGRSQNVVGYADNRKTPYIQSFNFSIQHELARNITLDVGWVANKATKLWGNWELNESNIYENGILNAFNITRAGGDAPLFDKMLMGLNVPGAGVVNGTTITGSSAMRKWSSTQTFIANGNVGGLADFLNRNTAITGLAGGLLANGNLPANFISVNPQFNSVSLNTNIGNSTYNSLQTTLTQRYTHGFSGQVSYVFSKNIGLTNERDLRNRQLSKGILSNNRTHILKFNGAWDLPFGTKGYLLRGAPVWLDKVVGGWTLSQSMQWISGTPLSFTTANGTTGSRVTATANLVGTLSPGNVIEDNGFVQYFPGLKSVAAPFPTFASDTTTLQGKFTNKMIVDASGNPVLTVADPGKVGNLSQYLGGITGPSTLGFDLSMSKKVIFRESMSFTFRGDVINFLNHPVWGNPNTNIDSSSFGRITTAGGTRSVTLSARFDF